MKYGYCILAVKLSLRAKFPVPPVCLREQFTHARNSAGRRLGLGDNFKERFCQKDRRPSIAVRYLGLESCGNVSFSSCVWPNRILHCETLQSEFYTFRRQANIIPNYEFRGFITPCITLFRIRKLFRKILNVRFFNHHFEMLYRKHCLLLHFSALIDSPTIQKQILLLAKKKDCKYTSVF